MSVAHLEIHCEVADEAPARGLRLGALVGWTTAFVLASLPAVVAVVLFTRPDLLLAQ
jgi:hypothetical protein